MNKHKWEIKKNKAIDSMAFVFSQSIAIDKLILLLFIFISGTIFGMFYGNIVTLNGINNAIYSHNLSLCVLDAPYSFAKDVFTLSDDNYFLNASWFFNVTKEAKMYGHNRLWNNT